MFKVIISYLSYYIIILILIIVKDLIKVFERVNFYASLYDKTVDNPHIKYYNIEKYFYRQYTEDNSKETKSFVRSVKSGRAAFFIY